MVHIHRIVACLSLLAAPGILAQLESSRSSAPDDINTAAAAAAPRDNPIVDEDKTLMRKERHGLFGPVTVSLKAGDDAPDIEFTKVLHTPGTAQWSSANSFSQTTVIVYLPLVSPNPQQVEMWNGLVDRFVARPVELVLITQEQESTLLPWLAKHPVNGWLLYDPAGSTGRAYGLEMPNTIYVGVDRKIIAFSHGFVPREEELNAVLDGRIRTEPVKPDPASLREFAKSGKVLLRAEPSRMPSPEDNKPKFPPSYEVHITSSTTFGTTSMSAPDYWSVVGFDLKSIVARVYGVEESRVDFRGAAGAGDRYDVALVLPQAEGHDAMMGRIQDALKQKFNLKIASEDESMDVYVVTAPYGPGPKLRLAENSMGGSIGSSGAIFALRKGQQPTPENIENAIEQQRALSGITLGGSISVSGSTIEDFCRALEKGLDRKVVDETHLTGRYDFDVIWGDRTGEKFFDMLREQLGLAFTPEQRDITMLVVRSM
jgi:uncharacterized protein (TIGR03435 family)